MPCLLRFFAPGFVVAALAVPLFAEPTPGPPDWADAGASVYLGAHPTGADQEAAVLQQPATTKQYASPPPLAEEPPKTDTAVALARYQPPAVASANEDDRRLAAPRDRSPAIGGGDAAQDGDRPLAALPKFGIPSGSLYTIASALAIVIGVFLLFVGILRRGGRNTTAALPPEVVSVLGRVPLAARQFAELVRVGNKLVLVSLTPAGAETLTEVTDPVEVDRIVGLCQQYNPHSTTKAFEQVFRQLSHETVPSDFLGDGSLPQTVSSAASAYRAHRGGAARG